MKVKILRGLCLAPGVNVTPGDVVEVDEARARYLVQFGKAAPWEEPPPESAPTATPTTPRSKK